MYRAIGIFIDLFYFSFNLARVCYEGSKYSLFPLFFELLLGSNYIEIRAYFFGLLLGNNYIEIRGRLCAWPAKRSLYCRKVFFDDNLYYDVGFYVEMQMISYMRKLYKVWGV